MTKARYDTALTIAGSDGSGGAGIQADLKTFAALGCYGLSVITAVTAQSTTGVAGLFALPADFVAKQLEVLLGDIEVDAVKIGMLAAGETITAVGEAIRRRLGVPLVLDTVLTSSSGMDLLPPEAGDLMARELFPLSTLVTPNLREAAVLAGLQRTPSSRSEMERAAELLLHRGAPAVLVTGGHLAGETCDDFLLSEKGEEWFSAPKVPTRNAHGTGCTLSSAIAAHLARGFELHDAVRRAKIYTLEALRAGAPFVLGKGSGPLRHLHP